MTFGTPQQDPNQPPPEASPQQPYPDAQPGMSWQQPVPGEPYPTGTVPAAEPEGRIKTIWTHPAVMVGTVGIIVLLIVAVTLLAMRGPAAEPVADGGDDEESSSTSASGDDGRGTSKGSGNDEESPAAEGDETYFSGKLELCVSCSESTSMDFDTGETAYTGSEDDPKVFDGVVTANGVETLTKKTFGEWTETETPAGVADCDGIAEDERSEDVHLSRLQHLATFCFTTAEDRTGFFVVDKVELAENGSLRNLDLSFTVFKGAEDL